MMKFMTEDELRNYMYKLFNNHGTDFTEVSKQLSIALQKQEINEVDYRNLIDNYSTYKYEYK